MAFLEITDRLKALCLTLITDFPRLLLTILGVAVLLGLLGSSLHLQFTDLLRFKVTVLFFDWERVGIGELLTIPINVCLTNFDLDLSWDVITVLFRSSRASDIRSTVTIIFSRFNSLTVKFDSIRASNIIDHFLLHVAIRCLHINALVVIFSGRVNLKGSVADPILASEAPLNLVSFFQGFVMNSFNQTTNKFVDIKAHAIYFGLNYTSAVLVHYWFTIFFILSPTSLLSIGFTLIFKDNFLFHVTIRFSFGAIPIDIGLTYLRIILRWRSRSWIFLRTRRKSSRNICTIYSSYRQDSKHIKSKRIHLELNK